MNQHTNNKTLERIVSGLIETFEEDIEFRREFPSTPRLKAMTKEYLETLSAELNQGLVTTGLKVDTIIQATTEKIIPAYQVYLDRKKELLEEKNNRNAPYYVGAGMIAGLGVGLLFRMPAVGILAGPFTGYIVKQVKDLIDDARIEKYKKHLLQNTADLEYALSLKQNESLKER